MSGVRGKDQTPGEFRRIQVAIGSTRRFIPPPVNALNDCLSQLEQYIHSVPRYDPLVECFLVHYQFETIHPFMDGNGRVGRLLLALMLQKNCGLSKPWLYMSEFYEKFRDEYVKHLFNASTDSNWEAWIEYCLNGILQQAKTTVDRCDKLVGIREKYMRRIKDAGGSVRLAQIIDDIFNSPFVRVAELAMRLGVTYPTAKSDLDRLVEIGILMALEGITPNTFYAPEVFGVSYDS